MLVQATDNLTAGLKNMEIAVSNMDVLPQTVTLVFDAGMHSNYCLRFPFQAPLGSAVLKAIHFCPPSPVRRFPNSVLSQAWTSSHCAIQVYFF